MPADLTMPTFSQNSMLHRWLQFMSSHLVLEGAESGGSLAGLGRGKGGGRAEDGSEAGGGLHVYERVCWNCELEGEGRNFQMPESGRRVVQTRQASRRKICSSAPGFFLSIRFRLAFASLCHIESVESSQSKNLRSRRNVVDTVNVDDSQA